MHARGARPLLLSSRASDWDAGKDWEGSSDAKILVEEVLALTREKAALQGLVAIRNALNNLTASYFVCDLVVILSPASPFAKTFMRKQASIGHGSTTQEHS
jgi:hypothetical protein